MLYSIKNYLVKYHDNPWLFFVITFLLTWLFWLPAALLNQEINSLPVMVLIILGGIAGKIIPPTVLPYLIYGKKGWHDYWIRIIDFKRVGQKWWLITLLAPVLFTSLGIVTSLMIGEDWPAFTLDRPLEIIPFAIFILLYGPLPEEMGWTGYELDRLQAHYLALTASLILGLFWALWHLPLFFIDGSYQHSEVVLFSSRFWLTFLPGIVTLQILQTWIYNNTARSTLTAIMIHFMVNFNGEILMLSPLQEYLRTAWGVVLTLLVIKIWGAHSLTGNKKPPEFKRIVQKSIHRETP